VGERRIGVALSDPAGVIAQPLSVIERRGLQADLAQIAGIVAAHDVDRVVVGYPLTLAGRSGTQARRVDRFIEQLRRAVHVEIVTADERLSTVAAERALIEGGLRRERRRKVRDAVAAALILQADLDRRRVG
jgi:putative Holliday junction resolvase